MKTHFLITSSLIALLLSNPSQAQFELHLTASDAAGNDRLGTSVATDGVHVVVGAPDTDDGGTSSGSVYVFDAASGAQLHELHAVDAATGDDFGASVGIAGSIVVVGSPRDDDLGSSSGAVYLFDVATGNQLMKLLAADGSTGDRLGTAVAIDGATIAAGAPGASAGAIFSGAAYVFDLASGLQVAKVAAADAGVGDALGTSIGVAGSTVIAGAPADDAQGLFTGAAYLFDMVTGNQMAKLTASDAAGGDMFGTSVAISGGTAIVGAPENDDDGLSSGAAYLFDAVTGAELSKLTASDGAALDGYGDAVAISGATALVGASLGDSPTQSGTGSGYLIDVPTRSELAELNASDGAFADRFGEAVALAGSTAVLGASFDDDGASNAGSAYRFDLDTLPSAFPGTSEDLVMETLLNGAGAPGIPRKPAVVGDVLLLRFLSPSGTFDNTYPILAYQAFTAGAPPTSRFPGIALDNFANPGPVIAIDGGPFPPGGIAITDNVNPTAAGLSVLFQAFSLTGSAANGIFASTRGHVIDVL